jgi:hypothetical protein
MTATTEVGKAAVVKVAAIAPEAGKVVAMQALELGVDTAAPAAVEAAATGLAAVPTVVIVIGGVVVVTAVGAGAYCLVSQ